MLRRLLMIGMLLALLLSACASDTDESQAEEPRASASATAADRIEGGTTFSGDVRAEPGVSGALSFVIADSGDGITEAVLDITFDAYPCGAGSTISGGGSTLTWTPPIPIDNGAFESRQFSGVFDSPTSAHGTIDVMAVYECPGTIVWTAEARD